MGRSRVSLVGVAALLLACGAKHETGQRWSGPATLVLVHTADLHSHVFPEPLLIGAADARRGLGHTGKVESVGGFARIATLIDHIRQSSERTLYLDSGDLIEGTAAFTEFGGEPELRALSALAPGAVALGNHDLDPGAAEFVEKHRRYAQFPVLAANYAAPASGLGGALAPYALLNVGGLRVGVIGVANPASPGDLASLDNPYGVSLTPLAEAVQGAIDSLRPNADLIVALTHLGLKGDEEMIRNTSGLDVVLGGHQHLTIDSALERFDCAPSVRAERGCHERRVILIHSGAFGRYVGRVDLTLEPVTAAGDGLAGPDDALEVISASHSLLPAAADVPEQPALAALLEPYRARLAAGGYDRVLAFALGAIPRYGAKKGDSPLGNLIADAIRAHTGSDLALLNTTGIRADLAPGPVTKAAFVAALPFADTLTVLRLSGAQLNALFDKQAQIAGVRGCECPFQGSGFRMVIQCTQAAASVMQVEVGGRPVDPSSSYSLVTTEYSADNGAGFEATPASDRVALDADPLDLLIQSLGQLPVCGPAALPCLDPHRLDDGRIAVRPKAP